MNPAMSTGRRTAAITVGATALLLLPFVVPVPADLERLRSLRGLGSLAHFGLPALLTLVLYRWGPVRGRLPAAAVAAVVLASSCELLQIFVARHPRLRDVGVDLAGATAAVGWILWRERSVRRGLWLLAAGVLVVCIDLATWPGFVVAERQAARRFPLLSDFETRIEMSMWGRSEVGGGSLSRVPVAEGGSALLLEGDEDDPYPGALAIGLPRDWSGYDTLTFRVRILSGGVLNAVVRLDDYASRRDTVWCGESFRIGPEWTTCVMDLRAAADDVEERAFRLDDIDSLLLYLGDARGDVAVLFDDITLR